MCNLDKIEARFSKITNHKGDLSKYPMPKSNGFSTDKDKSREFAEVFTPLHIVDKMLDSIPNLNKSSKNLDLCAGHGQFTIRMIRKFSQDKNFDLSKYLKNNHFFAELQLESCFKLLWIFGTGINLAIGDALQLKTLPHNWKGIWLYVEKLEIWVNITNIVKTKLKKTINANNANPDKIEKKFVEMINNLKIWINNIVKEPKMEFNKLMKIPAGKELMENWVRTAATDVGDNWQDVKTPKWIAKEMIRCIPDLKNRTRFLVLFNVEILNALVEENVPISEIMFASDSALEEKMVKKFNKELKTIFVGHSFDEMKKALEGHEGQYDVVVSNPPYQVMDEGFGASARPIYHEIVMYVIDYLKPQYVCMITPSRWMAGGKGLDDYRTRMLNDKHIRLIVDYPGSSEVFENNNIKGGVSYFSWDINYNGPCEFNGISRDIGEFDVLVRDNTSVQILKKVLATEGKFCNQKVLSRKPFSLATNFDNWVPEGTHGSVKCYTKNLNIYFTTDFQDNNKIISKWKVCTSRAINPNSAGCFEVYNQLFLIEPMSICNETYIVTGTFSTKKEADNYMEYMKTKFYRFMLSLRVISQDINKEKFGWVPDFGDYTNSYTDEDLFAHYNLTKKEIEHIQSTIKEIK
jgi:hypothetical protein